MLFRILLSILLPLFLYASGYPHLFSQMGTPLYKASKSMQNFSDIKELKPYIKNYTKLSKETIKQGFKADTSTDEQDKKKYLFKLRILQKEYDKVLHQIHENINKAINKKDYKRFFKLLSYEMDGLLKSRALLDKSIKFYKKKKTKRRSKFLESKITHKRLVIKTQSELYVKPIRETLSSHIAKVDTKKSVYVFARQEGRYLNLFIKNKNPYSITARIKASYKNLSKNTSKGILVVNANSTKKYLRLYINKSRFSYKVSYAWQKGSINAVHDYSYVYRLPYALGSSKVVSQGFNGKATHKGANRYAIDFAMKVGTKIFAARDGIVVDTKDDSNIVGYAPKYAKYGNFVTIIHDDGTFATYYHLRKNGVHVRVGQKVKRGQYIANSGNTGYSSGPHLHFEVYRLASVNSIESVPIKFLSTKGVISNPIRGKYYKAK